jgi:peroxiredoxin
LEKNFWLAYREKGLQVIGLNVWDKGDVKKINDFVKKYGLTYLTLIDQDEKVFAAYMKPDKPRGVPTNAVVDRKGKISFVGIGFDEAAVLKAVQKAL